MNTRYLLEKCLELVRQFPDLEPEIMDIYQLCLDEIEGGSSEMHEVNLALNSLSELIEE